MKLLLAAHAVATTAREPPVVGFIGLGTMGWHIAAHLQRHSVEQHGRSALVVWNRSPGKALAHAHEHGTTAVDAPEDLHECDVILLCLPTSADVESVLARVPLKPGVLVIDCTSGEPATSRRIATTLHERCGARFVDAPVSGGPKGAHTGTLTSMLGGTEADCAAAREWVSAYSAKVVRCGPSGAGDAVKAVNNVLNSAHLLLATEGLLALRGLGVDPSVALEVINSSSGRSLQTERLPENVLSRRFAYGFALSLMRKDVAIADDLVHEHTPDATLIPEVARLVRAAEARMGGSVDYTEMARFLEVRGARGLELTALGDEY